MSRRSSGLPTIRAESASASASSRRAAGPTPEQSVLDELVVETDAAIRVQDEEREPDARKLAVGGGRLPVEPDDVGDAVDVARRLKWKPSRPTHSS
jgi:hypothetical protein